jgi:hypothetical protein
LTLTNTRVSDVAALAGLVELRVLALDGTHVRDLAPLAGLSRLEELTLSGAPVSDLAALGRLGRLRNLQLERTGVRDLSPLGTCGSEICASGQFCEDLYKGHSLDARGRPLDRKKCMPLPETCKAKPTCACVTKQVASTHCTDEGGHVYVNDYPVRR